MRYKVTIVTFLLLASGTMCAQQQTQPLPAISGGGQSVGGTGVTQGAPDTASPPNPNPVTACKFGKMALAHDKQGLENQAQSLKDQIAGDQEALRHLKLENRAADFEEWQKLTDCAKQDLQSQMVDYGIASLGHRTESFIESLGLGKHVLDPAQARQMITEWKEAGMGNSYLYGLASGLAGTDAGKKELTSLVKAANDGWDVWRSQLKEKVLHGANGCSSSWLEAGLDGAGTILGWLAPGVAAPYLDAAKFVTFGSYDGATYYASMSNIEALDSLTDEQLRIINMWKDKLVGETSCLKQTHEALAKLGNPPKKHGNTGKVVAITALTGGSVAAGLLALQELNKSNSSTSCHGQCDGASSVNACGSCSSDAQCGNGGCFQIGPDPPCGLPPGSVAPFCQQ